MWWLTSVCSYQLSTSNVLSFLPIPSCWPVVCVCVCVCVWRTDVRHSVCHVCVIQPPRYNHAWASIPTATYLYTCTPLFLPLLSPWPLQCVYHHHNTQIISAAALVPTCIADYSIFAWLADSKMFTELVAVGWPNYAFMYVYMYESLSVQQVCCLLAVWAGKFTIYYSLYYCTSVIPNQ